MHPSDIGKAYDQITHLWESECFNRNNGITQHQRAIAFVENRGKALDVGCGCTGRFIDLLLNEGFSPEGLDISTEMLSLAKKSILKLNSINKIFVHGISIRNMTSSRLGIVFGMFPLISKRKYSQN